MDASFWLASASLLIGAGGLGVAIVGYRSNRASIGDAWAREWAAQRPVIYPALPQEWLSGRSGGNAHFSNCHLFPLKNGGRGPALNVTGTLEVTSDSKTLEHQILSSTIAAGDVLDARLVPPVGKPADWARAHGVITYSDLAGGRYTQRFTLTKAPGDELELILDQPTQEPGSAVPLGDAGVRQG